MTEYAQRPPGSPSWDGPDGDELARADADWLAAQAEQEWRQSVERRAGELRLNEEARRLLIAQERARHPRPKLVPLADFLARPMTDPTYRVDEVWPTGGRVVLSAQFKAGKTTIVGNVLRALADGTDLFDRFPVRPGARIVLIDDELDDRHLQRWLTDQAITNQDAIRVVSLRGQLETFDIRDRDLRAEWAHDIDGADIVVLDCLRPILDALNLDENREAGRFLGPFDALLHEAGASEALVLHHMGHHGERSRGDSRIQDWPDALWTLVRDKSDDDADVDDVAGSRYFSAFGRDVNVPQAELTYDPTTRHLSLGATALTRRESTAVRRATKAEEAVLAAVTDHPGVNVSKLRHDVRTFHGIGRNSDIDDAADRLVEKGLIYRIKAGNSKLHYPSGPALPGTSAHNAQPAPHLPGQMGKNMPARPIGAGMTSHTPDTTNNTCPHGMTGGHNPDPFVAGRLACPACAKEAK